MVLLKDFKEKNICFYLNFKRIYTTDEIKMSEEEKILIYMLKSLKNGTSNFFPARPL